MPTATLLTRESSTEGNLAVRMPSSGAEGQNDMSVLAQDLVLGRSRAFGISVLEPATADIIFVRDEVPVSVTELKAFEYTSYALPDPDDAWRRPHRRQQRVQASLISRARRPARLALDIGNDTEL